MPSITSRSYPSPERSTLRRPGWQGARRSRIPDLAAPYKPRRIVIARRGLAHSSAWFPGCDDGWVCCGLDAPEDMATREAPAPTCLWCAACRGCPACRIGWIRDETMRLGRWVTKDERKVYPFEMDGTHLVNAINKLYRDEHHFKDDWRGWVAVLEAEARQRGLI